MGGINLGHRSLLKKKIKNEEVERRGKQNDPKSFSLSPKTNLERMVYRPTFLFYTDLCIPQSFYFQLVINNRLLLNIRISYYMLYNIIKFYVSYNIVIVKLK